MEIHQNQYRKPECEGLEADLRACVGIVFDRCPGLCGFSVAEREVSPKVRDANVREWELYVSDIALSPELCRDQADEFHGEISGALGEFLNERPEAAGLLTGRTFARTWH